VRSWTGPFAAPLCGGAAPAKSILGGMSRNLVPQSESCSGYRPDKVGDGAPLSASGTAVRSEAEAFIDSARVNGCLP
jgi:hypothetical protein